LKLIKSILGGALAAGLMTFASDQAQASVVINNTLYSPLKIKLTIAAYNNKGVVTMVSVTSKQILKVLGYTNNAQLAVNTGGPIEIYDICIISKVAVLEDLSAEYIMTARINELLYTDSGGNNDSYKYSGSGILSLNFYNNPQISLGFPFFPPILDPNWRADSEAASDYWFEISGLYAYRTKLSAINGGKQNYSIGFNAKALSGLGYDVDLNAPNPTTVTGSASARGGYKIDVSN
jgi:hypothetical protein